MDTQYICDNIHKLDCCISNYLVELNNGLRIGLCIDKVKERIKLLSIYKHFVESYIKGSYRINLSLEKDAINAIELKFWSSGSFFAAIFSIPVSINGDADMVSLYEVLNKYPIEFKVYKSDNVNYELYITSDIDYTITCKINNKQQDNIIKLTNSCITDDNVCCIFNNINSLCNNCKE